MTVLRPLPSNTGRIEEKVSATSIPLLVVLDPHSLSPSTFNHHHHTSTSQQTRDCRIRCSRRRRHHHQTPQPRRGRLRRRCGEYDGRQDRPWRRTPETLAQASTVPSHVQHLLFSAAPNGIIFDALSTAAPQLRTGRLPPPKKAQSMTYSSCNHIS